MSENVKELRAKATMESAWDYADLMLDAADEIERLRSALAWTLPQVEAALAAIGVARSDPYVKQSIEQCAEYRALLR